MLWGKLEFARELSRQLVEIASIKKGLRSNPELLDRIERIEKSHQHLLRKLAQGLQGPGEKGKGESRARARSRRGQRLFKEAMAQYLKRLWDTGAKLRSGALRQGGTALSETRVQVKTADLPKLDQSCALCGRVLLSSVLAGEDVILHKDAWYHRKCADNKNTEDGALEEEGGLGKPGQLN